MKKNTKILLIAIFGIICFLFGNLTMLIIENHFRKNSPEPVSKKKPNPSLPSEKKASQPSHGKSDTAKENTTVSPENPSLSSTEAKVTEVSTQASIEQETQTTEIVQPQELLNSLAGSELTLQSLEEKNCSQLITVNSSGNQANISLFDKDNNGLWKNDEVDTYGFVGTKGVSADSYEGSYHTPKGFFPVGQAFYIDTLPETNLEIFQITDKTYWVDDPNSEYYNQKIEGYIDGGWNSAEHMIDYYNSYRYGFVINFNMGEDKWLDNGVGKGSAIFFHISYSPTAGCVGVSEDMMTAYLKILDKSKNPFILIQ